MIITTNIELTDRSRDISFRNCRRCDARTTIRSSFKEYTTHTHTQQEQDRQVLVVYNRLEEYKAKSSLSLFLFLVLKSKSCSRYTTPKDFP